MKKVSMMLLMLVCVLAYAGTEERLRVWRRRQPGVGVNAAGLWGQTLLHQAVVNAYLSKDVAPVRELLNHPDIDPNIKDDNGRTPLQLACLLQELPNAVVDELLKNVRVELEAPESALIAVAYNRVDLLRQLIKDRAIDVNMKTRSALPLLYYAVKLGYADIVRELLGAADMRVNECSKDGLTPLHRAVMYDKQDIIDQLLQHSQINVNVQDKCGYTPLHYAVIFQCMQGIKKLLEHQKVDVNIAECNGLTALDLAVVGDARKNEEIKTILTAKGCRQVSGKKPYADLADLCALIIKSGGRAAAHHAIYWMVHAYTTGHKGANMPIDLGIEELRKKNMPNLVDFAIAARDRYYAQSANELVAIINELFPADRSAILAVYDK